MRALRTAPRAIANAKLVGAVNQRPSTGLGANGQMLLLHVSYVGSLMMRDLTSRSAPSFGTWCRAVRKR
jgi:hypothetical protein